jgi:hypothetical protein
MLQHLSPARVQARLGSRAIHARSRRRGGLGLLVLGLSLLVVLPAVAGQSPLPSGVPNIFDRSIRSQFELVGVVNLRGNPDIPVLVVLHKQPGGQPRAMLLALDARNMRQTWSLATDPIILIVVYASPQPAVFANGARDHCGLNRSPCDRWPGRDRSSLGHLDTPAISRDAGRIPGAPITRRDPTVESAIDM